MSYALLVGGSLILGYVLAELWHRRSIRQMRATQQRNALVAEYVDKQLWQFISLDEWLNPTPTPEPKETRS